MTQKASQVHQGVLGFPGVCSCQACSCKWNHICISGCWCFSGRAALRSAPDKTPPTQFPVSGRFIPDGFHSQHSCPQAFRFKAEAMGHFLRWEPHREATQFAPPTPHNPIERIVFRKMSMVSSLHWSRGRASGMHRKRCHFLHWALSLSTFSKQHSTINTWGCHCGQPHLTAYKGFLSNSDFHFY